MPSMTRRVATTVAFALPLTLAPASAVLALPTAAPAPAIAPANDGPTPPPKTKKPAPPTWRQYISQRPRFSAKACTADVTATAAAMKKKAPAVECAQVLTPLDWNDLRKGGMVLQVTRVAHVSPAGKKTSARGLFVNPGGPGGPAGAFTLAVASLKPALRTTHDIIGVDPRGTGGSTPLPCAPNVDPVPDYRVTTPAVRAKAQAAYRTFALRCVAAYKAVLPYITTANTVHDQDLVRRLMRFAKADWYGVSGGSWMGAYYARLHPGTVGRVVVDANTNFGADWRTSFHDLPMGFQRRYDQMYLPWVARQNKKFSLGRDVAHVRAAMETVRAATARGKVKGLTPNLFDTVVFMALYKDTDLVPLTDWIGQTYRAVRTHKRATASLPHLSESIPAVPTPPGAAPAEITTPVVAVRSAIVCNDGPFERTPASFETELAGLGRTAPLMGYEFGMVVAPCAYWKVPTSPKVQIANAPIAPMLMLQNQMDPATPIEGAKAAHAAVRNTRMITVLGGGDHGALLPSARNSCVEKYALAYLQKGVMPRQDATCTGNPMPGDTKVYRYTTG